MNCNCYETICQRMVEDEVMFEGRQVLEAEHSNVLWVFNREKGGKTGTLSYEEFVVELEGLKRPKKMKVAHVYCPYCGTKANNEKTEKQ